MIYVRKGVGLLLILTIPGAIALALLAPLAARLVHITEYLPTFRVILLAYVISIPFESINHLLLRSYYATKHTLVPAFGMVVSVAVAVSIAWKYLPVLGVQALGIGYTAGAVSMTVLLAILLPLRLMRMQLRVESNVS
jgi:peptidoglycan biosynthesis protein MviN/MurJ (putative lipid II flippase)